jgi:hypothetical protein
MQSNVIESAERMVMTNYLAHVRKFPSKSFKVGEVVLFKHPHTVGMVQQCNMCGHVTDKLPSDIYRVVYLNEEKAEEVLLSSYNIMHLVTEPTDNDNSNLVSQRQAQSVQVTAAQLAEKVNFLPTRCEEVASVNLKKHLMALQ